jgi:hypothetical protein
MVKLQSRENLRRCACRLGAVALISCVAASGSRGQAAVESARVPSNSTGIAPKVIQPLPSSVQGTPAESNSAYPQLRVGPPVEETNRKALEAGAGKDAAKLLLRSVPSQATIYIDGMIVGRTPLLLIIPPGKHKVEMRGESAEFGERVIDLLPNETQQLALTLTLRYPASISVHPGPNSSSATNAVAVTGALLVPASSTAEETRTSDPALRQDASLGEANRKALEQQAGKDAAKLLLRSVPGEAMIYVDAMFVGRAPQVLSLPPGKHKVEMRGQHEEFGERLVGLLPNETQQLTLTLSVRYPASILVR